MRNINDPIQVHQTPYFVDVLEVVVQHQLQNYVRNVQCNPKFAKLKGFLDFCAKLVETN
jgi:uncharacterized protein Usg